MGVVEDDEEPRRRLQRSASPRQSSGVDEPTQRLTALLKSALELSSSLLAQHAAAQRTISALELNMLGSRATDSMGRYQSSVD